MRPIIIEPPESESENDPNKSDSEESEESDVEDVIVDDFGVGGDGHASDLELEGAVVDAVVDGVHELVPIEDDPDVPLVAAVPLAVPLAAAPPADDPFAPPAWAPGIQCAEVNRHAKTKCIYCGLRIGDAVVRFKFNQSKAAVRYIHADSCNRIPAHHSAHSRACLEHQRDFDLRGALRCPIDASSNWYCVGESSLLPRVPEFANSIKPYIREEAEPKRLRIFNKLEHEATQMATVTYHYMNKQCVRPKSNNVTKQQSNIMDKLGFSNFKMKLKRFVRNAAITSISPFAFSEALVKRIAYNERIETTTAISTSVCHVS